MIVKINDINVFSPQSRSEMIHYAIDNKKILIALNAEKILHCDVKIKKLINRNLGYPDGIGAVWALQKIGKLDAVKIPGCELWLDIINEFYISKSFYLVGGSELVINETVAKLKKTFKGINILNFRNGYLENDFQKNDLLNDIKEKKPDVVFVAMGSPKQELLMEELHELHPALYQGLGGSFDVYTGYVQRAPKWWVDNNLEWAYRLIKQPSRIKRQIHLLKFLYLLKTNQL